MTEIESTGKVFTGEEVYNHVPAECEYYVLCESQYGTQQCSMKRDACLRCNRRQSYINENAGTDKEEIAKYYDL